MASCEAGSQGEAACRNCVRITIKARVRIANAVLALMDAYLVCFDTSKYRDGEITVGRVIAQLRILGVVRSKVKINLFPAITPPRLSEVLPPSILAPSVYGVDAASLAPLDIK